MTASDISRNASLATVTALAAALGVLLATAEGLTLFAVLVACMVASGTMLGHRLRSSLLLSPLAVVATVWGVVGVVGLPYWLVRGAPSRATNGLSFAADVSNSELVSAVGIAHLLPALIVAAVGILLLPRRAEILSCSERQPQGPEGLGSRRQVFPTSLIPWLGVLLTGPLLLMVGVGDLSLFFRRDEYLPAFSHPGLVSLGQLGVVLSCAAAGYVAGGASARNLGVRTVARTLAVAVSLLSLVLLLGLSSRRVVLVPFALAAGIISSRGLPALHFRRVILIVLPACAVGLALMPFPLAGRSVDQPGVGSLPEIVEHDLLYSAGTVDSITANAFASVPLFAVVAWDEEEIDSASILTSLNPLPGSLVGWSETAKTLRVNAYTPYSGIGELWNFSGVMFAFYFVSVGGLLGLAQRQILARNSAVLALIYSGASALFAVTILQYNLRSATRIFVYMALVYVAVGLAERSGPFRSRSRERRELKALSI